MKQILKAIERDELFGMVECDIHFLEFLDVRVQKKLHGS